MRTRSSRFFVILLHLLGVSNHHLPSWYYDLTTSAGSDTTERARFYSGIRGVHPHSIVLERIDLQDVGGLDGVEWLDDDGIHIGDTVSSSSSSSEASTKSAQHQHRHLQQETATAVPREPFWLQDSRDGKCLGPNGGFSECGDATLWFILRQSTKRKSLRMGPFGVEEILEQRDPKHPYRYALQIVDNDYEMGSELQQSSQSQSQQPPLSFFSFWRQHRREQRQNDCLVPSSSFLSSSSVSLQQQKQTPSLELGPCAKQKKAWAWRVDEEGILYLPEDFTRDGRGRRCLRRTKASSAVLASCSNLSNSNSNTTSTSSADRLVQFSLVRYHATQTSNIPSSSQASLVRPVTPEVTSSRRSQQQQSSDTITNRRNSVEGELPPKSGKGLPKTRDIAHNHATRRVVHNQPLFEMNLVSRPLLTTVTRKESTAAPFSALKDSNPILFFGSSASSNDKQKENKKTSPSKPSPSSGTPGKLRRIEVHSYIAASKDEIWVDPQTGLEYHTDLCHYLGHDRKESGRHTLMGVGQFVKTMLKIKVSSTMTSLMVLLSNELHPNLKAFFLLQRRYMELPCTSPNVTYWRIHHFSNTQGYQRRN